MSDYDPCKERRDWLAQMTAMQEPMDRIIAKLPSDVLRRTNATEHWIQMSSLTREQVLSVLIALKAGRWEKNTCHSDGSRIDYETKIEGIRVLMHSAEPPTSCRIETEEIDVPAHKEIRRKLVCV